MQVANCRSGIDPNLGDQSGQEWRIQAFFNYGWNCVLRHPNKNVTRLISNYARHAALNDRCGYSQANRLTFWNALEKLTDKDPKNIITVCDADCSSSTASIIKAVGYTLGIPSLKNVDPSLTTFTMRQALIEAGFIELTSNDVLYGSTLIAGDVVLNESCHVVIAVNDCDYDVVADTSVSDTNDEEYPIPEPDVPDEVSCIVQTGDDVTIVPAETNADNDNYRELTTHICRPSENSWYVWAMQYFLKEHKYYTIQATGIFDTLTSRAFVKWQKENALVPDCQCGELSWRSLYQGLETMIGDEADKSFIVKALQYLLRAQGYYIGDGDADGIFGVQLYNQVIRFQKARGLEQTGIVNDLVWEELVKEWV